jgi:NAD(P)H-flavin reductase
LNFSTPAKQSLCCELVNHIYINNEIFRLDLTWEGPAPKAGQFFMVKPKRSSVFLARPISVALWRSPNTVRFLIAIRGRGTTELLNMRLEDEVEMTGPLGNAWGDFLPPAGTGDGPGQNQKPVALVGGGIGLAPLTAFAEELPEESYDFYVGFRIGFRNVEERYGLLGPAAFSARSLIIATEDGSEGRRGRIPDFIEAAKYAAVYACGPEPMLKAVTERCKEAGVPCFVSMERRMACGVGACLGCTVPTVNGNRRCCADGPIFPAEEVLFDE